MSDFDAKSVLDKHLTHSTKLGEVTVDFNIKALKCGFPSIESNRYIKDNVGNVIIIAARPGNGKTALACQIGLNVAEHTKVLMFSMEMEKEELKRRFLAVTSNVPIDKLGESVFKDKVAAAQAKLSTLKFHINEEADLSAKQIVSKTYDENSIEKIGLVIIDYIGMLDIKASSRNEGIKEAAKVIKKQIADHLKIPVLLLAQMNRNFEDRAARGRMEYEKAKQYKNTEANEALLDVRPSMSDLAESSGIEHAADLILFLQREYLLDRSKPESAFRVFVEKNRKGAVRDFELEFSSTLTKFIDKGSI